MNYNDKQWIIDSTMMYGKRFYIWRKNFQLLLQLIDNFGLLRGQFTKLLLVLFSTNIWRPVIQLVTYK